MATTDRLELIEPADINEGDVVDDPAGGRRLTIQAIQVISMKGDGMFSFYGAGPNDGITVSGAQTQGTEGCDDGRRCAWHRPTRPTMGLGGAPRNQGRTAGP